MEKYNELTQSLKIIKKKNKELENGNTNNFKLIVRKMNDENKNYQKSVNEIKENNEYVDFDNILINYIKSVNSFNLNNEEKNNIIYESFDSLEINLREGLFNLSNIDIHKKKYENNIFDNFNSLDTNLNYFIFKLYNFKDNIIEKLNLEEIKNYLIYLFLSNDNRESFKIESKDKKILIKQIQEIYKLENNHKVNKLVKNINDVISTLNELDLINYLSILNRYDKRYRNYVKNKKELSILINKDIFKINDFQFFYFILEENDLTNRYQDIIEYLKIKTDHLESHKNYKDFEIFYNIIKKINNKITDLEEKEENSNVLKIKTIARIDDINELVYLKKKELVNLKKKSTNNYDRKNKINFIIDSFNEKISEYPKTTDNIIKKIEETENIINFKRNEIHKLNKKILKKKELIDKLIKKLNILKENGDVLYERYEDKLLNEKNENLSLIRDKKSLDEEFIFDIKYLENMKNKIDISENDKDIDKVIDNESISTLGLEKIDKDISNRKKKEKEIQNEIIDLINEREDLIKKENEYTDLYIKLSKNKKILEDDLYHNQQFIKKNFNELFFKKYHIDTIKNILSNLITNYEKKKNIDIELEKYYSSNIFFDLVTEQYNSYINLEEEFNKKVEILYTKEIFYRKEESQILFNKFIENIIIFIKKGFRLRLDNHNYFHMKKISDYYKTKLNNLDTKLYNLDTKLNNLDTKLYNLDTELNNLDTKLNNLDTKLNNLDTELNNLDTKLNNSEPSRIENDYGNIFDLLVDNEYNKIFKIKSKLKFYGDFINNLVKEKLELINEEHINIKNNIISSNKLRVEQIKIQIQNSYIQKLNKQLDVIYKYLITNIHI